MYSAYLFLAFIFGRTLVVQAVDVVNTLKITVAAPENDITEASIKVTLTDDESSVVGTYAVNRYTNAAATEGDKTEIGTAITSPIEDTGLKSGTTYYYKLIKTVAATENDPEVVTESIVYDFTTLFDELAGVTVEKVESTSATFKWAKFDTYKDTSVKIGTEDKPAPTEETYELKDLKPSTKSEVSFQGFAQNGNGEEKKHIICTAPSKPTITNKIESTTADPPVNTLTLTIKFSTGDLVSSMDFETGVKLAEVASCTSCQAATFADDTNTKFTLTPTDTATDGPEFTVVFGKYPEANTESDIKVTAKFNSEGGCTVAENIGVMETTMNSVATLANKQAMLVYLAIGTMATVLRLLGMEVWTPIGLL